MAQVTYADPTTTRTPLHFDVMPPIQQASPIVTATPTRQPFNVQQEAPGQLARPINYHAQPQNIPNIQQQIKNDATSWKTIEVVPNNTARPRAVNTTQSVIAGTSVVSGNSFAQEQAFEQLAYLGGWTLSGLWDGAIEGKNYPNENLRYKRDFAEDGAYALGYRVGDELRNLGLQGKSNLEELWRNRPQFEIPTIKIPKFQMPGFPDFSIPKIPEFLPPKPQDKPIPGQPKPTLQEPEQKPQPEPREKDIPRFRLNPPPSPVSEWQRIREWIEKGESCEFAFNIAQSVFYKNSTIVYREPGITSGLTAPEIIDGTGESLRLADGIFFIPDVSLLGGGGINAQGKYGADTVKLKRAGFLVIPSIAKLNVSVLETFLMNGTILNYPAYTNLQLSPFSITSKEFGYCKTRPQDPPIPKSPPKPEQDCDMTCCPEIDYRKLRAIVAEEVKKIEAVASVPDYWQTRSFQKPQLAIQYAEDLGNNNIGRSRWCLHIPHYNKPKEFKPSFPKYKKGNVRGILTLNDNTKIIVHCQSDTECLRVINSLKKYVDPKFLEGVSKPETTKTNKVYKQSYVVPTLCQFFPLGQKDTVPEWTQKLRAAKK